MAYFGNKKDDEHLGINEYFDDGKKNEYLITVEPNNISGDDIASHRITASVDFAMGFKAALETEYSDHNKYRVNCIKI